MAHAAFCRQGDKCLQNRFAVHMQVPESTMRLACAHEQLLCLWLGGDMPLQQPLHGRVQRAAAQLHRRGRLPLCEAYPLQLHAGLLHLVQRHELRASAVDVNVVLCSAKRRKGSNTVIWRVTMKTRSTTASLTGWEKL